jgi:hypothetical protein
MSSTKGKIKKSMGKVTIRNNGRKNSGKFGYYYKSMNKAYKTAKRMITTIDTDEPIIPKGQLKTKKCVVCHDEVLPGMNVCDRCFNINLINLNDEDEE